MMNRHLLGSALIAALTFTVMACGGRVDLLQDVDAEVDAGPATTCTPGEPLQCRCSNGSTGVEICKVDGSGFGPCSCRISSDGGRVDASVPDGAPDTGFDATTDGNIDANDGSTDGTVVDTGGDTGDDGGTVIPSGGDISTAPFSMFEAETHTAVGPNQFVVVAWIAIPSAGPSHIGYRFSSNFGVSWHNIAMIDSPAGREASDPVIAADAAGNFYMTWIGYHLNGPNAIDMQTYVATAPAGSTTFNAPVAVSDPAENQPDQYDKPWITVTAAQTIVVTWTRFDNAGSASVLMARSTDGQSWTRSVVTTGNNLFRNLAMPCTAGARLWTIFLEGDSTTFALSPVIKWSDDQGATWPVANQSILAPTTAGTSFDDPSCVAASASEVWGQYELTTGGATAASSVMVAHSTQGGSAFGAAVQALNGTALAWHPQLGIESNGALDLVFYGGATDPDTAGSYRRTRSVDQGLTFAPSTTVKAMTFLTDRQSQKWIGDYVGLAWNNGELFTSFTDNSGAISHISFTKLADP